MTRDEIPSSPSWRDVALVARRIRETAAKEAGQTQRVPRPRKHAPRNPHAVWVRKPGIDERAVQAVVTGEPPYPRLSRTEAMIAARRLAAAGFSAHRIAARLDVNWRTVYRLLQDGKNLKQKKTGEQS